MTAIRLSCAALLAGLLVVLPTQAEEVKKKPSSATRASPQAIQKQQASSQATLPGDGPRLDQPKGAATGGPAGSLNMGKPMAPVGTQAIGGQATGGSAAAGANLGTTTTNAQPTSGNTLVNPNAKNDPGGGAMPKDFSRGAKLQDAVDGGAGALVNQAGAKESTAPGRTGGAALIDGTQSNFEAMRGDPGSRTSQQGMFPATTGGTDANAKQTPQAGQPFSYPAPATESKIPAQKEPVQPVVKSSTGDEAGTLKGTTSGNVTGNTRVTAPGTVSAKDVVVVPLVPQKGDASTPTPDGAGAGTPVPASVTNLGGKGPTLDQTKKERGRQTTLPNDDKQQVDRMKADERAAGATMAERRGNAINPGEQGTTGGAAVGGPPPSQPGVQSGRPQNSSKSGAPPRCPADNPTC